jgi:hypothetical protein
MINFGLPPSYFDQLLINFRAWLVRNYQALLISGTNIKTINGNSILGSGDLIVSGAAAGFTLIDNAVGGNIITGTTSETILHSKRLPANSNGGNFFKGTVAGILNIELYIKMAVAAGANDNRYKIYFNKSSTLTGSPVLLATTPLVGRDLNEFYCIKRTLSGTSLVINLFEPTNETLNDEFDPALLASPALFSSVSPDTGHSGDFWIIVTVTPTNVGNSAVLRSSKVTFYGY